MRRPGRVWLAAAAATVVVAGLGWAAMPSASAATNLVTNPGFETGTLTGWTFDASDSVVTGHAHAGTYALQGEYEENDLFPTTDLTEDWMKLTDFDPDNVIRLGPVRPRRAETVGGGII